MLTVAASRPSLSSAATEKAKLREFDKAWADATNRGDRPQLEAIFADDFASTDINGSQNKTTTIDAAVRAAERNRASGQTLPRTVYDNYLITCTPVSAVITHRASTTTTMDGKEQTSYFRSVHVLEKRGGRWQVVGNAGHALTDAAVLLYLENDWNDARIRKDIPWFERILTDDLTAASAITGTFQTKSQYLESIKADKSVIESISSSSKGSGWMHTAIIKGTTAIAAEARKAVRPRARFTVTW